MRKALSLIALVAALATALGTAPAASASTSTSHRGCVTKSEYNRIWGQDNIRHVTRVFGTSGRLVKTTVEHTQELHVFWVEEDGQPVAHTEYKPFYTNHYTYKYDKCSSWGKTRKVTIWFETWRMPEGHVPAPVEDFATHAMRTRA